MKRIVAYKGYYAEFMAKLSEQERKKIMCCCLRPRTRYRIIISSS